MARSLTTQSTTQLTAQLTVGGQAPQHGKIAYQPALDGVRAVAVTMVVLFHGKVSWMSGGYVGVSMFFTLSGFLITSLLLRELESNASIAPKAFYARRMKRLLPASLVCLSAVSLLAAADVWKGVDHLRRDAMGALFQVANWVQLFSGESYTDLQSKNAGIVSPLDHYWSLAIEEQFYWIWPLAFLGLVRLARRFDISLARVVGAVTLIFCAAAPITALVWGRDAAYWATPARAGEILLGAGLAVALAAGRVEGRPWMAPFALVAVVTVAVLLPAAGGPAYYGAFPIFAVGTALLLLGLQRPGPVTSMLSVWPLVALGKISYGVYLYHFPILVLMSPARIGLTGGPLLVLQIGVTIAVAMASYWLIERPIRLSRPSTHRTALWSVLATAAVLGVVITVPSASASIYYAADSELAAAAGIRPLDDSQPLLAVNATETAVAATDTRPTFTTGSTPEATPDVAPDSTPDHGPDAAAVAPPVLPTLSRPARILVVGDSTAEATGAGLVEWAVLHPDLAQVTLEVSSGCGFVRGGVVPSDDGVPFQPNCDRLLDVELPAALVELQPDVVMLMVTARDVVPRRWSDAEGLIDPRDPNYVSRIRTDYQTITDLILLTTGARIVWIHPPKVDPYWMGQPHPFLDPELHATLDAIVRDTVAANHQRSQLLDLRAWMEADGIAANHESRPDGWHLAQEAALYVAESWLGPQLVESAADNAVALDAGDQPGSSRIDRFSNDSAPCLAGRRWCEVVSSSWESSRSRLATNQS